MPPPAHGLSGAAWMVRIADQVTPLSVDVIMRMFPVVPTFRYSWQTAYIVPPPSIATAGSPTNMPVALGIETLRLQVTPPLVENENAHTRVERSSIQPASARPPGPVASATSVWRPLPVSSLRRMFGVNTTAAGVGVPPAPAPPPLPPRPAAPPLPAAAPAARRRRRGPPRPAAPAARRAAGARCRPPLPPLPPRPAAPAVPVVPPTPAAPVDPDAPDAPPVPAAPPVPETPPDPATPVVAEPPDPADPPAAPVPGPPALPAAPEMPP